MNLRGNGWNALYWWKYYIGLYIIFRWFHWRCRLWRFRNIYRNIQKKLSETKVEYILPFYPHDGLTHGYGSWQENFVCYAGRYFCRLDEEQEKKFKEEKITSLISELNKEGVEEADAASIVLNSIENYKHRYNEEPSVLSERKYLRLK